MARLTKDDYFKKLKEISHQEGSHIEGQQEGLGKRRQRLRKDIQPRGRHVVIRVSKNIKAKQKTPGILRGEYGDEKVIKADKNMRKQQKQNIFRPKLWERN